MLRLRRWWQDYGITAAIVFLSLLCAWWLFSYIECACNNGHGNPQPNHYNQSVFDVCFARGPVSAIGRLWIFIAHHFEAVSLFVTAIATAYIARFTLLLRRSTDSLATLASNEERTHRIHERAYILWGGLYGAERTGEHYELEFVRRDPARYDKPWTMQIHNFGRTPGFVTRVRWNTYESVDAFKAFVAGKKLSELIESGTLKTNDVPREVVVNPTFNPRPWPYRFVFQDKRENGTVTFGMINYRDVFKDPHYSVWAAEIQKGGVATIGDVLSNDWS